MLLDGHVQIQLRLSVQPAVVEAPAAPSFRTLDAVPANSIQRGLVILLARRTIHGLPSTIAANQSMLAAFSSM